MNTVYIDVLFLINFSVDYLALYLTGKALRLPLRRARLIGVAVGGAVYALWALLLCEHYILLIASAVLVCLLGAWLAYPMQKSALFGAVLFLRRRLRSSGRRRFTIVLRHFRFVSRSIFA